MRRPLSRATGRRASNAWLGLVIAWLTGCRQQDQVHEQVPVPSKAPPPLAEPPMRVGKVFRQYWPPPPQNWHVSPRGHLVAAPLDVGCGVWRFDSSEFLGVVTGSEGVTACEQWPVLTPISGTTPPTPLAKDALPFAATIAQLWWEPGQRWFAVKYSPAEGYMPPWDVGWAIVTRGGQRAGLRRTRYSRPEAERLSSGWYAGPLPKWLDSSLVAYDSWSGTVMQISPIGRTPIAEFHAFHYASVKPEFFELLGPTTAKPVVRMKICEKIFYGGLKCKRTEPIPRNCEPVGWTSYWILACERSGGLRFEVDHPQMVEPVRSEYKWQLPGSDRDNVEWIVTEDRLAWWSKQSGLAVYDSDDFKLIAELPEIIELSRATLDAELGLALVRSDAGLAVLDLNSATLGPLLPTTSQITTAAFAPDKHAVAASDGQRVYLWRLPANEELSWPATKIAKLAWRQDSKVLFGSSLSSRPEQAWDPQTGKPLEVLTPEVRARIESTGAQLDPGWRWAIIPGQGTEFVEIIEIIRLVDGLTLYVRKGGEIGVITPSGLYQTDSSKWYLDRWRVGFGSSPLADDWRVEKLTDHPNNARPDLVEAFFAGEPLEPASW